MAGLSQDSATLTPFLANVMDAHPTMPRATALWRNKRVGH